MESRKPNYNFPLRHFLMIPFEDPTFINEYEGFCNKLGSEMPDNYDKDLLQKPSKLHISALIFDLKGDNKKISIICDLMKDLQKEFKSITNGKLEYNFGGYDAFDSFKKARVIFSKMKEDENFEKLNLIIDLIVKRLLKESIIKESELSEVHVTNERSNSDPFYKIQLHLTLLNTTFLNKVLKKCKKKPIKNFDGSKIKDCIQGVNLPVCPLNKINFCELRENKNTGKYELIQSFDLI